MTATPAVTAASTRRRPTLRDALSVLGGRPVIDFLEQLVVLTDLSVVRIELEGTLVRLAGFVELTFVLVRNRQVVERGGVRRVDLGGFFPAVDGFAPEAALRDVDAEFDLRLGVAARVRERRACRHDRGGCHEKRDAQDHHWFIAHYTVLSTSLRVRSASGMPRLRPELCRLSCSH